ncbi:ribose-5-phosphate isomerase RpiA [Archaeoglobus profundus]|uniref:Ribose-5-phosphate isomerase A n=1 Tax=Archaeoglobus profundus (strain DSM 5631 / JCM 9629 / NBRC 100127 / Av18) TaxID=572546 RepID=D2RI11_ARCPA|nr:ribose-5-phosphate isomerase RpiA [Archaeoglobus profundus]ADB57936.1 ribose 5-phosphate isomerase [Archaeoglobus profundus DSM 5631]
MNEKEIVAEEAVKLVEDGMVLGIGSGTTIAVFLEKLGERIKKEGLEVYGVPSSYQSHFLALKAGIRIVDLFEYSELDLCIDGADQIDKNLNCIKGGGGALTREKIVSQASKRFIVIAEERKFVDKLSMPVPIEVIPFAYGHVVRKLQEMGGICKLREGSGKLGPVISDNGNFIIDCNFDEIENPKELELSLNAIAGIVENGIFCNVDEVILGSKDGIKILKR